MPRCLWCNHLLWLWQDKSPGAAMHFDCWMVSVRIIQTENQRQYTERQWRLRAKEEDEL